ncbi:zwei Ig domain protein zig-4 [Eurytemora carolleeae]|uniref:zwei Ig domain protein zig-4 n=1 Tax=Eurytemora carolleeae TaxID=1294199 RepID=UPI000C793A14|nr:zwei Ig domain protein zig-4 [Eurytemora carolleeae]|eukprot:XP_023323283.1 zwei Ig domain protein zig-4-like [Eurytemora affinis]
MDKHIILTILSSCILTVLGLGPPFPGDDFIRIKELPPAAVIARNSGGLTLSCSMAGSPTPSVAWFKDGVHLAGTQDNPGGLGETWARLNLPCITEEDAGIYECRGEANGHQTTTSTKVDVIGHTHSGCIPRNRGGSAPKITGWYSTVMITSGLSVKLSCSVNDDAGKVNVVWKDAMGKEVKESDTVALHGHDLYINGVDWSHMGRFTCTAQNGFGVDMISTFLYPLAPAFSDLSNMV